MVDPSSVPLFGTATSIQVGLILSAWKKDCLPLQIRIFHPLPTLGVRRSDAI